LSWFFKDQNQSKFLFSAYSYFADSDVFPQYLSPGIFTQLDQNKNFANKTTFSHCKMTSSAFIQM